MIFKQLLNESININEVKNQPYFKYFPELRLFHSTPKTYDEITHFPFKFRTKPANTDIRVHNTINQVSVDELGLPVRNLLFCYSEPTTFYGHPYMIVPKGGFRLFHNPTVHDMTVDLNLDELSDIEIPTWFRDELEQLIGNDEYSEYFINTLMDDYSLMYPEDHLIDNAMDDTIREFEDEDDGVWEYRKRIISIKDKIMNKVYDLVDRRLVEIAKEYVDDLEEITEYDGFSKSEIMVYAPNGFYVIPENHFETFV